MNKTKFQSTRTMPQWINENNSRIGPKPPPPPPTNNENNRVAKPPPLPKKNNPDPEYEVIDFGGQQQYSNAAMPPKKSNPASNKPTVSGTKCDLCGSIAAVVKCDQCKQQTMCPTCDDMYHRHPKRQNHTRKYIEQNIKPPIPPKGEGINAPVPPPRRNKKIFSRFMGSPVPGHKEQVPQSNVIEPKIQSAPKLQPPPSPTLSLREKMGSLKRMISPGNRPLPPTPDHKPPARVPESNSRPQTPVRLSNSPSPFDTIRRAPSLHMEKIQTQTSATLDRMSQLQQRYRQHQEAMRSDSDRSRRTSTASDFDIQTKLEQIRQRQQVMSSPRNMSASVFDLNQMNMHPQQQPTNSWSTNPMQQAQSMAHLNAQPGMQQQWQQQPQPHWTNNMDVPHMNGGSNMSLNLPPSGYFYPQEQRAPPPPVWMNSWGAPQMYPYPVGMMPMTPVMAHTRSRPPSRNQSRAASPSLSVKSRRSMMSSRHRNSFNQDLTDDEDSDVSDREFGSRSNRGGSRRNSHSQKSGTLTRRQHRNSSSQDYDNTSDRDRHVVNRRSSRTESQIISRKSPSPVQIRNVPQQIETIEKPVPVRERLPPPQVNPMPKLVTAPKKGFQPITKPTNKIASKAQLEPELEVKVESIPQPSVTQAKSSSEEEEESGEEEEEEEEEEIEDFMEKRMTNGTKHSTVYDGEIVEDDLGPPPQAPDHEWECEHCTFVNEPQTKICLVCCKTPTTKPKTAEPTVAQSTPPAKPNAVATIKDTKKVPATKITPKPVAKNTKSNATAAVETSKAKIRPKNSTIEALQSKFQSETTPKPSAIKPTTSEESSSDAGKKKGAEAAATTTTTTDIQDNESSNQESEYSEESEESSEEEIPQLKAQEKKTKPTKVSSGCGPSPPPEIKKVSSPIATTKKTKRSASAAKTTSPLPPNEITISDTPKTHSTKSKRSASVSTGTSPPPQDMSTQTYDVLSLKKHDDEPNILTRDQSSHSLRRSHSMAAQIPQAETLSRAYSGQSFSSDTQSLPMTPPDDPQPKKSKEPRHPRRNNEELDDEAFAYINRTLQAYGVPPMQRKGTDNQYRSSGDLGKTETYRSRRQSLMDVSHKPKTPNELTLDDIIQLKRRESQAPSGMELLQLLREAEQHKFTAEDVQAALVHCGSLHPVTWLRESWAKLIETVQTLATKYGHERRENTIGTISTSEARDALRKHKGNVWHAVTFCIEQRQKKFIEIAARGNYPREDIVTSLTANHGNVELALIELGKTQLKPFLMRVWGPPSGAENESGNFFMDDHHHQSNESEFFSHNYHNAINRPPSPQSNRSSFYSEPKDNLSEQEVLSDFYNNSNILRDIETLIGNMEQNQAKQNENMMRNIESLLENVIANTRDRNSAELMVADDDLSTDMEGYERLKTKSPIVVPSRSSAEKIAMDAEHSMMQNDVRNFVSQHIQDIVPDLVEHVQQEIQKDDELVLILPEMDIGNEIDNKLNERNLIEAENIEIESIKTDHVIEHTFADEENINPTVEDNNISWSEEGRADTKLLQETELIEQNTINDSQETKWQESSNAMEGVEKANEITKFIEQMNITDGKTTTAENAIDLTMEVIIDNVEGNNVKATISNDNVDVETIAEKKTIIENLSHEVEKITVVDTNVKKQSTEREELPAAQTVDRSENEKNYKEQVPKENSTINDKKDSNITVKIENNKKLVSVQSTANSDTPAVALNRQQIKYIPQSAKKSKRTRKIYKMIKKIPIYPTTEVISTKIHIIENIDSRGVEEETQNQEIIPIVDNIPDVVQANLPQEQAKPRVSKIPIKNTSNLSPKTEKNSFSFPKSTRNETESVNVQNTNSTDLNAQQTAPTSQAVVVNNIDPDTSDDYEDVYVDMPNTDDNNQQVIINPETTNNETVISTKPTDQTLDLPADKRHSQNLSELVMDTQKLIQQMKDEIATDIASLVSEDEYGANSDEWTDDENYNDDEYYGSYATEEEGWTDVSSHFDSEDENLVSSDFHPFQNEMLTNGSDVIMNALPTVAKSNNQVDEDSSASITELQDAQALKIAEPPIENKTDQPVVNTVEKVTGPVVNTDTIEVVVLDQNEKVVAIPENIPNVNNIVESKTTPTESKQEIISNQKSPKINESPINAPKSISSTETVDNILNTSASLDKVVLNIISETIVSPKVNPPTENKNLNSQTTPDCISKIEPVVPLLIDTPATAVTESAAAISIPETVIAAPTTFIPAKETPAEKPVASKTGAIKKTLVRKRSITGAAPTSSQLSRTSSFKNVQSRYLNNTSKPEAPKLAPALPKPSAAKSQNKAGGGFIKTIANKITKAKDVSNEASKMSVAISTEESETAKIMESGAASVAPVEAIKPKKKYFETCYNDYQTSDDEDTTVQQQPITRREFFKITSADVDDALLKDPEALADDLLKNGKVPNLQEARLVVALLELRFDKESAIWASSQCSTIDHAINILQQECELCMEKRPMNEMVSMLKCTHKCCKDCAKNYFTVQVTERAITDCTCPFCKLPDLHDSEIHQDDVLEYFSNLDILLKNIISQEAHDLFQRKMRDRTLAQDPTFKWCIQCSFGFCANSKQKILVCPNCELPFCSSCRKPWAEQHEGKSCEVYAEWLELNDPEKQNEGVTKHLQLNGITCPNCKFQYSLARGGCLHFTCTQCKFDFCYGCARPFMMGAECGVSAYCAKLGLHAHHPRNCLFYLRDKEPHELQRLLKSKKIKYETESLYEKDDGDNEAKNSTKCPIPIQKETRDGYLDTVCNSSIEPNNAGMCRIHFVEYLVNRVCAENVDPLPILDICNCEQELKRRGMPLPERGPWDTDPIYLSNLRLIVEEQIPLN